MRRVLSLWLCRWPTDRLRRCSPARSEAPLVTVATVGNRRMVLAVDRAAALAGLAPGMTLADARARVPEVTVVEADPEGDARALSALADWCRRCSPWTAPEGTDGVWIDVTGAVPLFPSEEALADGLLARLRAQGFAARAAVADTAGAAWAVCRFGVPGEGAVVVPPDGARAALADLPVAALRLPEEIRRDLNRLGLRRIGDLYPLPRAPLAPRFGMAVARRLDQALGLVEEPISPRLPVEPRLERLAFAEPVLTAAGIERGLCLLLERLCRRLERDGLGVRRLALACYRVDARVERVAIGTSRPSRDPAHLARLLVPEIERIDPGLGIEVMVLEAPETGPLAAAQIAFNPIHPREGGSPTVPAAGAPRDGWAPAFAGATKEPEGVTPPPCLAPLVDRLAARLGPANVRHLAPRASHLPERAVQLVPGFAAAPEGAWPARRPRPVRLVSPPDPVEVVAPVPDDPPLLFRWRRQTHRVRHAEGPERLGLEWWRRLDRPVDLIEDDTRDYYRVEDMEGRRFWLYRRGLYRPGTAPRWFLHGFFP